MRTATVRVWCQTQFTIEIHDTEPGIVDIPLLAYRFIVQKDELKCVPDMLRELNVDLVDVLRTNAKHYAPEYLFARLVFAPRLPLTGLVQQKFW